MATDTLEVVVKFCTAGVVSAAVRDSGVHDVRWTGVGLVMLMSSSWVLARRGRPGLGCHEVGMKRRSCQRGRIVRPVS